MNITEIETQLSDLVNEPFDPSGFVFKFIEIFNPPKATLTKLRKMEPAPDGELLWPRKLQYRVSAPGQATNVVDALKEQKIAKNKVPRFIISTDGKDFSALDTKSDESRHCDFKKLNDHFDFFLPLAGINKCLMRMFGPKGNPQASNLFAVISYLQEREGIHLEVKARNVA